MFVDEAEIIIKAGDGGNGCSAFRREKYVPMGGPSGGNGGRGSNIIFKVDTGLNTLLDFKIKRIIKGNKGKNGEGDNRYGRNAEDIIIKVPAGTIITDLENNNIIGDLTKPNQEVIIAKGGRGGRGNKSFATHDNPAPKIAEKGEPGEEKRIKVELKLLADVGLVGMPSVGKSTIISMISSAKPKIAAYHFTTLTPNLGVVKVGDKGFVIADLPGLIKGASLGEGLGDQFLKHIERTKVIVHVIDMSGIEGRNPYEDYINIKNELKEFNSKLLNKPQLIIANKMDIDKSKDNLIEFKKKVKDIPIYEVSAVKNEGFTPVLYKIVELLENTKEEVVINDNYIKYEYQPEEKFIINKINDNTFEIKGDYITKLYKMTNFDIDEGRDYFLKKLRNIGVDEKLEKLGAKEGDTVKIFKYEFEYKR
ncbi:MAG: GTPase ObgE [Bacilli bacterium]